MAIDDLFGRETVPVPPKTLDSGFLVTNHLNLFYMLSAGLVLPPAGFGRQVLSGHLGLLPRLDSAVCRQGLPASDQLFNRRSRTPEAGGCRNRAVFSGRTSGCGPRTWHSGTAIPGATRRHRAHDPRAGAVAHILDPLHRLSVAGRQTALRGRRPGFRKCAHQGLQGQVEQDLVHQIVRYPLATGAGSRRTADGVANAARSGWRHGDVAASREPR